MNIYRVNPTERLSALKKILDSKGFARVLEAHSGLSGIVAERTQVKSPDGTLKEFDAIWESSLTDSATKGLPDASIVGTESRIHTINEILQVTTKPLIVDGDTGGEIAQFEFMVSSLERIGVSAVIIEDKVFPKRNSLDASASQELEDPERFAAKISAGKAATVSPDFMIISRLESLIAGYGVDDALKRAEVYINAGTDGIMIHSNKPQPEDLFSFVERYEKLCKSLGKRPALVSVPTTYNQYKEEELSSLGFDIVIHANHQLRASYKAMHETATMILESERSMEADSSIASVKEVFSVVGFDRVVSDDREISQILNLPVIIPAAGKDPVFDQHPKSLIEISGRPILDYQRESIAKTGIKRIAIVRGHMGSDFDSLYKKDEGINFLENTKFLETGSLHSLLVARDRMDEGFALVYSDILFGADILQRLIQSGKDIVLGLDNSYRHHQHQINKKLDLVATQKDIDFRLRRLSPLEVTQIVSIGKNIDLENADSEFIGMGYFSAKGAEALIRTYEDCTQKQTGSFHESGSFEMASITDMIQELIRRGFPVHGLGVTQGWMEIHTNQDIEIAESELAASLN